MKPSEKFKLSRELNALVAQVQAGDIKGMEKFQTSRRINEIVTLLGGGSNAPAPAAELTKEGADQFHENLKAALDADVDLSPFERIVQQNEITIETLQGAVNSTKMLLNSVSVPGIVVDAVKVVSERVNSGALLDSLGADGTALIRQLATAMLDSTNNPDSTDKGAKTIAGLLSQAGWTVQGDIFSQAGESSSFVINKNRLYTFDVEVYQGGDLIQANTCNGVYLKDVIAFINTHIQADQHKIASNFFQHESVEWFNGLVNDKPKTVELVDAQAQAAATSVINEGENPTQEQLEANDYKTAQVTIAGMDISIENPIGSVRRGVDQNGEAWETTMTAHYGYFNNTLGADGDELDVFIAEGTPHDFAGEVFVIGQIDAKGNFDEHKVVLGVQSGNDAKQLYRAHYDENFNGMGYVHSFSLEEFKNRIFTGRTALLDSIRPMMLDSWAADGKYELLPFRKLDLSKLDQSMNEAKATIKEPIVVFANNSKLFVVHGRKRLDLAHKNDEKFIPSIIVDAGDGYSMDDVKAAIRKCGNVVHAEALGALVEECASKRLEAAL